MKIKFFILSAILILLSSPIFAIEPSSTANPGEGGGAAIKEFSGKVLQGLSDGLNKINDEIQKRNLITIEGKVKVSGSKKSPKVSIKTNDGNTYELTTISGSSDSIKKLALAKNEKISASGILNKESKVFTVVSYVLVDDESQSENQI